MKQYKKFYREVKGDLPRIYCDMDGVLCDFVLAAKRATGQNWLGLRSGQDWESIKRVKNFWSTMPWTGDGRRLWNFIKKYQPHILSAYSIEDPNCIPGKRKWLKSNLGYTQNSLEYVELESIGKLFGLASVSTVFPHKAILISPY